MKIAFVMAEDINLGAGYVISYLKKGGHDVRLFFDPRQFDRGYSRNRFLATCFNISESIIDSIDSYRPDIVCFSVVTAHYLWGVGLAGRIKARLPQTKIIFGGIHPTIVPEEVRKHKFIDDVIVGDGIKYFSDGKEELDPDKIWPDREIFLKELPPEHRKIQLFMTGIGCPFNCSYCGQEQLRAVGQFKFKRRSVQGCLEELKHLKENGATYILFVDDIFIIDEVWLNEFCALYKKEIGLPYSCFIHPKYVKLEIVNLLKYSGCQTAWMGIQTGLEALRREILNRKETNQEIIDACKLIKASGIKLMVDHIFGIPFETELSNDLSQVLYDEIKPDVINCYQLLYFPKSAIIQHALRSGHLTKKDVEQINRGEGITYQTNNKGQRFYDTYAKAFHVIPLGGIILEFLPLWLIKILVLFKAGRGFTIIACLQNEFFFTWRAIKRRIFNV